jgi:hypothetical protein
MHRVTQFKVNRFRNRWWWFLYITNEDGTESVARTGNCRSENMALLCGMIAWAKYDMARKRHNRKES